MNKTKSRVKKFFIISIPSVLLIFLFMEFIFFRFILPASEWPYRYSIQNSDDVVRYIYADSERYRTGIYRRGAWNEVSGRWQINQEGWNSSREYVAGKSNKFRIAVIGDSFVDAQQVDVGESFSEVLESELLGATGSQLEVYRFGFGGASLSQYLQTLRYVKKTFLPDIVIIHLIPNDFLESIEGYDNSDGDFLQFRRAADGWTEIKPKPYRPNKMRLFLKRSATFRYFYEGLSLRWKYPAIYWLFSNRTLKTPQNAGDPDLISRNYETIRSLAAHIVQEMLRLAGRETRMLFTMDADRLAIYKGQDPKKNRLYNLTVLVSEVMKENGAEFIDLTDTFESDYKVHKQPFDFRCDYHWNERGHHVVGQTIALFLLRNNWIPKTR